MSQDYYGRYTPIDQSYNSGYEDGRKAAKERIKYLEAEVEQLRNRLAAYSWEAENTALRQICRDAYEVWAGSEGIPEPQTAAEAYLLSLVEKMRDEVKRGLK